MAEVLRLPPLPTIKELLRLYEIRALKQLSQNFLLQSRSIDKIVCATGGVEDCEVCEVGPGPGGITRSILAHKAKKVIAIEKDERFEPILESLQFAAGNRLKVVYADILGYNLSNLFDKSLTKKWEDSPPNIHIIGNLPFSIADALIFKWIQDISLRRNVWSYGRVKMTLTFQEEVGRRMVAQILSKARSGISVMCQNWCKVRYRCTIPGTAFLPKPEVNVAVVQFEPLIKPLIDLDYNLVQKVMRIIFNTRQKYCKNSLKNLFPKEFRQELLEEILEAADIEPEWRPFQISNDEIARICYAYDNICKRDPRIYKYNYRGPRATREDSWKVEEDDEEDEEETENRRISEA